jgi:predicted small integral membrane protein
MTVLERCLVLLKSVLRIIFGELDLVWLAKMWSGGDDTRRDMIKIIFMVYLLKCRL